MTTPAPSNLPHDNNDETALVLPNDTDLSAVQALALLIQEIYGGENIPTDNPVLRLIKIIAIHASIEANP